MARSLRLERSLAELGPGVSEPQPTTVSHDGGSAGCAGARVPRCTPARPQPRCRPSTRASPDGGSGFMGVGRTLRDDLFVPMQLGRALATGDRAGNYDAGALVLTADRIRKPRRFVK